MARVAVRLRIEGRVQGVGYRWWALEAALSRGLAGWVRNRADGSVEILAIGAGDAVDAFMGACAAGPSGARVSGVTREPADDDGSVGFQERATV